MSSDYTSQEKRMPTNAPSAAEQVARLREALGLSQEQFAKKLKVTRVAVLRWEKGKAEPSSGAYVRMAQLAR